MPGTNIKKLRLHGSTLAKKTAILRSKLKKIKNPDIRKNIYHRINQLTASRQKLLLYIRTGRPTNYLTDLTGDPLNKKLIKQKPIQRGIDQNKYKKITDIPVDHIPSGCTMAGLANQVPADQPAGTFWDQIKIKYKKLLKRIKEILFNNINSIRLQ